MFTGDLQLEFILPGKVASLKCQSAEGVWNTATKMTNFTLCNYRMFCSEHFSKVRFQIRPKSCYPFHKDGQCLIFG